MIIYKKEKQGKKRIITLFGIKFEYRTGKDYKFEKVVKSGVTETKRTPKIIVSLTSFPSRINSTYIAISSLLNQTLKPDEIILWLAEEQFPGKEKDLPTNLLGLKQFGLTIEWCKDLRSYKKLIPALTKFPEDIIVTVDDDFYFSKYLLERLHKAFVENPKYIHCHRCTKIYYKDDKIKAKIGGKKYYKSASFANKLCGGAGTLYPPGSLYKDVSNENLFMTLAPTNDDIWFWLMAVMQGTKINVIKNNIPQPAQIEETMDGPCLCKINDKGDKLFYKDLENVLKHYQGLEDKIKNDIKS